MGAKFSVDGLPAVKTALEKGGKARTDALTALLEWSRVEENRVFLGSERAGLLPRLRDVARGGGRDQVVTMEILLNLSAAEANRGYMASPSVELLPVLKELLDIEATRLLALNTLQNLAIAEENRVAMASTGLGLLPALMKVINERTGEDMMFALGVLQNLAAASANMVPMASPALGLLPLLIKVVEEGTVDAKVSALDVLSNLSIAPSNKALMAGKNVSLLAVLVKAVREGDEKATIAALDVLNHLAAETTNKVPMAASHLGLLSALKKAVEQRRSGAEQVEALAVLERLAIAPANKLPMASQTFGLLLLLIAVADTGEHAAQINALGVLTNLSVLTANKVTLASPSLQLLPLLMRIMFSEHGELKMLALKLVSSLSLQEDNHALLASTDLGLMPLLTILASNNDKDILKLVSDIRRNLSKVVAAQSVEATTSKVLAEYGVALDLFIACLKYQIRLLDARIAAEGTGGLAYTNKSKLESDFAFALSLSATLPQEFMVLHTNPRQAEWIVKKLRACAGKLLRGSDDLQLAAFSQFLFSLPRELQGTAGDVPYAVVTEHYVVLKSQGGDCVVVDGFGPIATAIKIRLKKDASTMITTLLPADIALLPCLREVIAETSCDVRLCALRAILSYSSATNSSVLLRSDLSLIDALLTLLAAKDAVVLSLEILYNLSSIDENKESVGSGANVVAALQKVIAGSNSEASRFALRTLHNLSSVPSNYRVFADSSVLVTFVKQISDGPDEFKFIALGVLVYLSRSTECSTVMIASSDFDLVLVLTKVIEGSSGESKMRALEILRNLSDVHQTSHGFRDMRLLKALVNVVVQGVVNSRAQELATHIFRNLSAHSELCLLLTSLDLGLLPALKRQLAIGGGALCLPILQNIAAVPDCCVLLGSAGLELMPVLVSVAVREEDVRGRIFIILQRLLVEGVVCGDILSALNEVLDTMVQSGICAPLEAGLAEPVMTAAQFLRNHQRKLEDMAVMIKAEHGMSLDLYFACIQYQFAILDDQVENFSGKGPASVKLLGDLMEQRTHLESVRDQLHQLRVGLPPGFQALGSDSRRQAHWLQQELDSYSDNLMKNKKDLVLLRAFSKFHASLPAQLQEAQEPPSPLPHQRSADAISATSNAAHALLTGNVTLDAAGSGCVVVDGTFCDGPMTTPVKIKLRSIEHSAMIHHEYNMLCKFHKHVPSAVVAPFALVSTADSTLRKDPNALVHGDLSKFLGIVLEKGTMSMDSFLSTPQAREAVQRTNMLVDAVKIVEAAHGRHIALMDFKPENMVYCLSHGHAVAAWKAIDFDNSRHYGEEVAKASTPEYASYEMARHMLDANSAASLKADPAMDICSLGWTVWVIFNNGVSLWDMLGLTTKTSNHAARREQDRKILAKLASMTQSELLQHINAIFADDTSVHSALRRFLPKLLHVDPRLSLQADQLRTATSLLGTTNPTILSAVHGIHSRLDEMSAQFRLALDGQLHETALVSIKDNHAANTASTLAAIVGILEQQREDAKQDRLSMAHIKSAMDGLPTVMASSLLPSINAILADQHDQTMTALDKLDDVTAMMKDMKLQLDEVLSLQRTQLSILNHLQQQGFKFPHTFIILPQRPAGPRKPKTVLGRLGSAAKSVYEAVADQLFTTMYLFFFCPVTGKLVPCGPGGQGYMLSALKAWVKQLVPIIRIGLLVAKVVLATQGLGGIIPNFPNKEDQEHLSDMLADLTSNVEQAAALLQNQAPMKSLEAGVIDALDSNFINSIVSAVAKQDGVAGTLVDIQGYIPQHVGLMSVTYLKTGEPSTVAWVSEEGKAAFQRDGPKAFQKIT